MMKEYARRSKGVKLMQSFLRSVVFLLMCCLVPAVVYVKADAATAVTTRTLNYQGYLTDASGTAITGSRSVVFTLYDAVTGGTNLWTETQTVTVTSGYFNVELGSVDTTLETVITTNIGNKMWLGINVAGDGEMTARQELTSTSFAFVADKVINPAQTAITSLGTLTGLTVGTYTLPTTNGTSGYVLTTNGAGTASWSAPTGAITLTTAAQPNITSLGTLTGLTVGTYTLPTTNGTSGYVLTTNGSGTASWSAPTGAITLTTPSQPNITTLGGLTSVTVTAGNIALGTTTINSAYKLPTTDGTTNQVLKTDGAGTTSWTTVSGGTPSLQRESATADADPINGVNLTVTCSGSKTLTGGGCQCTGSGDVVEKTYPSADLTTWNCRCALGPITAYAICLQ
ncbi:secreted protein [Candidatus Magnetobacterium bavaricum]|uniref:Secreted protein n=1 Tax=Candidatus Magnetobacterium bavaricum TaxID=29290 RepID=A0A0F3GS30_9BACT|nr:secreted protein [Candidatus Magnetobacterium bavaricum]